MLFGIKKQSLFSLIVGLTLVGSHAHAWTVRGLINEWLGAEEVGSNVGDGIRKKVPDFFNTVFDTLDESFSEGGKGDKAVNTALNSLTKNLAGLGIDAKQVIAEGKSELAHPGGIAREGGKGREAANALIGLGKAAITEKVIKPVVIYSTAFIAAYYGLKWTKAYAIEKVKKPAVIVEWHQEGLLGKVLDFSKTPALAGKIAFQKHVTTHLKDISKQVKFAKKARFKIASFAYPNVCVTGEYGSGKTVIARKIARKSTLDYAVVPAHLLFEKDGQTGAIDDLFAWIGRYNGDLCLVIDGAELLFSDRSKMDPSSNEYRTVSHFMACLETYKNKLMLVITSKNPVVDQVARKYINETVYTQAPAPQAVEGTQKTDAVAITAAA
jgi:hypothetical protein